MPPLAGVPAIYPDLENVGRLGLGLTTAQAKGVQFAPIADAAVASTQGAVIGESRQLADGENRGARIIWGIPDGATTPTWCWWNWPQSAYL